MNIRAKIFGGATAAEEPVLVAKKPKGAKADTLHSIAVQRELSRRSDSRNEDRHRLTGERARITHNCADHQVELINLSGGGAMISGPLEAMLWDRVDLHLGEHGMIECVVRWIRDNRIGLEFAHETRLDCSADEVATVLRDVIARSFPDVEFELSGEDADGDQVAADEHRAAPRHPLIWNGKLRHDYQTTPVRVRNISSSGAMIESIIPVRVGAETVLELSDAVSLSATVMWAIGDQVGLSFHSPFEMSMLAQAKPSVAPSWLPTEYLEHAATGASEDEGSAWDPRWKRCTMVQLHQELEGFLKR